MTQSYNYNTQRKKMALPEYGRSVQNMVDYAMTIEDRAERQRCANTIVNIMGSMFPHLRDIPDFKHKLWDHLAIMSDFKLDIDYPYEIVKPDNLTVKPERIPYSAGHIRYRHYGRAIELLIQKAVELPDGDEKRQLIRMIASHMKKDYITWNKDTVEDQKIFDDIREMSDGKISLSESDLHLDINAPQPQRQFVQRKRTNNNSNNQKRKY